MKVINPFGKSVRDNHDIQPFACMCHGPVEAFAEARTTADTCVHCGCNCGIILSNGNYTTAAQTDRTSSVI